LDWKVSKVKDLIEKILRIEGAELINPTKTRLERKIWIWKGETKFKGAPHAQNAPHSLISNRISKLKNLSFSLNFNSRKYSLKNVSSENKLQKTSCRVVTYQIGIQIPSRGRVRSRFLQVHLQNLYLVISCCDNEEIYWNWDCDLNCSDIKGIMSALQQIREKSQKDGQKKNEQTISRSL